MRRLLLVGFLLVPLSACQLPNERAALRPLPEDGPPLPYAELLTRARSQATLATEAYYLNRWTDLQEVAQGLEQTAHYLRKAEDVPPSHKDTLPVLTADLAQEAVKLREAASAQDGPQANTILARIHAKVRELRLNK
jgi:hypothetical protein